MSDILLSYFEKELAFIREESKDFSRLHPGSARSLGLSDDSIDDPQVTRLIDSVALLNAKLQKKLDDTYPEFTDSLLRLLFPHYSRPIPSYSILKMQPLADVSAKHFIPKGTYFDIADNEVENVVFRTSQDVTLFPINVSAVQVAAAPFDTEKPQGAEQATAMIEIELTTQNPSILFSELNLTSLEIFIRGETHSVLRLYDAIFSGIKQVCVEYNEERIELGKEALGSVGFDGEDALLPYSSRTYGGFKLLSEFFMFPERFHSATVDFSGALSTVKSNSIKIQFFLDELAIDLSRSIGISNFHLFCSPIVNLHTLTTDPLHIDFSQSQYPITLDASGQQSLQLFSIDKVTDVTDAASHIVPSLYGEKYRGSETGLRWQMIQTWKNEIDLQSSLRVADLNHSSAEKEMRTWLVSTLCTNGSVAGNLSRSSQISCRDSITLPATLELLRRPSAQCRMKASEQNAWPLLAHLHFNYHALLGADDPVSTLKAILNLYNHSDSAQNNAYIEAISKITQEQVVAPMRVSGKSFFAYGTRLSITLSHKVLGVELLSQLLDRFFAYYAGFNSFTEVVILIDGIEGEYKAFSKRSGCKNMF